MRQLALACFFLVACHNATTTDSSASAAGSSAPKSSSGSKTAAPEGPVFKAKIMGTDQVKKLVDTSLDKAEMPGYVIQAPEGAEVSIGRPGGGAHVVAAGVNYSVAIRESKFDPAEAKKTFNIIDPDGKVLTDNPDLVIYQRKSGSVLFGMVVSVGGKTFSCGSLATAMDFDRDTVDQTVASCRTLKAVGGAAATSASASAAPSTEASASAPKTAAGPPPKKAPKKPCTCPKNDQLCAMKCAAQ